jgi:hypothetical protein
MPMCVPAPNGCMGKLRGMGLTGELHETPGHPILLAKNKHVAGRRTVLLYGTTTCSLPSRSANGKRPPSSRRSVMAASTAVVPRTTKASSWRTCRVWPKPWPKHADLPVNLTIAL